MKKTPGCCDSPGVVSEADLPRPGRRQFCTGYPDLSTRKSQSPGGGPVNANDLGLVNCAGCDAELVGEKTRDRLKALYARVPVSYPPPVVGRIFDRPYCGPCLTARRPPSRPATRDDAPGPYYENALKALEG